MKCKRAATCFVLGAALAPVAFAAENPASMATINVDTDRDVVVWMSGTPKTQQDVHKAAAIAKNTEGGKSVKNDVKVQH